MGLFSISLTVAHSTSKRSKYGSKWAIIGILIFTGISPLAATSEEVEPAISDDVGENEPSTVNSVHDGGSVCAVPRVSLLSILLNGSSSDGRRDDVSEVSSCSARPKCDEVSGCTAPLHCFDFRQLTDTNASVIPDPVPHVVIVTPHQLESIVENSSVQNICAVVLFYAPWCTFSVQFAKKFNALGRSFDSMPFLAVNLAENEPYKYILAYLPLVAFYYRGKTLFKFSLDLPFEDLRDGITNVTGFAPVEVNLTDSDRDRPVPTHRDTSDQLFLALAVWWVLFITAVYGMKSRLLRQCCKICCRTRDDS